MVFEYCFLFSSPPPHQAAATIRNMIPESSSERANVSLAVKRGADNGDFSISAADTDLRMANFDVIHELRRLRVSCQNSRRSKKQRG